MPAKHYSMQVNVNTTSSPVPASPFLSSSSASSPTEELDEHDLQAFINHVINQPENCFENLKESLRDGVNLCRLLDKLFPILNIAKRHLTHTTSNASENIALFIANCEKLGFKSKAVVDDVAEVTYDHRSLLLLVQEIKSHASNIMNMPPNKDNRLGRTPLKELFVNQHLETAQLLSTTPNNIASPPLSTIDAILEPSAFSSSTSIMVQTQREPGSIRVDTERHVPINKQVKSSAITMRNSVTLQDGSVFILGNVIGKGQFGTVHRALHTASGIVVAIKRIQLPDTQTHDLDAVMHEINILQRLSSRHIVKYIGYQKDQYCLSIVVEYIENGSLRSSLKIFGHFNERLCAAYSYKVLQGLRFLHAQDVVHCDLKCANILTTKDGEVKLSDFGVSLNVAGCSTMKGEVNGTPNWLAPEVITLRGTTKASDIWALGCTVMEMIQGHPPYADQGAMSAMYSIVEEGCPPLPSQISDDLRAFFHECFRKEPRDRPTAQMLLEHKWFIAHQVMGEPDSQEFCRTQIHKHDLSTLPKHLQAELNGNGRSRNPRPMRSSQCQTEELCNRKLSHCFIKTSFAASVVCSVCKLRMRKAVMCEHCHQVLHAKCIRLSGSCIGPQLKSISAIDITDMANALRHDNQDQRLSQIRVRHKQSKAIVGECCMM